MNHHLTLLAASALWIASGAAQANPVSWVDRSNEYTRDMLEVEAEFSPESGSSVGLARYDSGCANLTLDLDARYVAATTRERARLVAAMATESDTNVKQDLQILIDDIDHSQQGIALEEAYLLPWVDVAETIFHGLAQLLDEQLPAARQQAALARLNCYIGSGSSKPALSEQAKRKFESEVANTDLLGPPRDDVQQALDRTPALMQGLRDLFNERGIAAADTALDTLETQLDDYISWVNKQVMPRARDDARLPAPLYAHKLRGFGIDIAPQVLIERAQLGFMETRAAMIALAPQVASAEKIEASDYRDVIRALKRKTIDAGRIESHYRKINKELEQAIVEHGVVDLPARDMIMRLASDAESAALPAPHMLPPPFIGNQGEKGQFVLTAGNPADAGAEAYDDFNFEAVAYTLSAHEGRPGHELQFTAMLENGVSLARVYYASNSVNAEGWALYAEAEMLPYEPVEGQLIALQHRLLRNARAMLDPMLNLGLITPEAATEFLVREVVLSRAMAKQEVDRYTIRAPGQAGSYFYGYSRILQLRAEIELLQGDTFDRLAFNNFILAQGLMPPDLIAKAVREDFLTN